MGDHRQHHVDQSGRLPFDGFVAAVAAGDIHVGPDSGPVHVAAAAGKPSVVIYGGIFTPTAWVMRETSTFTPAACSPCWLLMEPCPYDRVCLSRISPEWVEEAIESLARVEGCRFPARSSRCASQGGKRGGVGDGNREARPRPHLERRRSRHDGPPRDIRG